MAIVEMNLVRLRRASEAVCFSRAVQHLLLDEELGDVEDRDRNDDVADRAEEGDLALRPGAEELDHRIIQPLQDQAEGEEHQDEAREAEHDAGKKLHQQAPEKAAVPML